MKIQDFINTQADLVDVPAGLQENNYEQYYPFEPEAEREEADSFTPDMYDTLLSAELLLPKGNVLVPAKVISRKQDNSGNPIGTAHANPLLDTRVYKVEYLDGHTESCAANIITENIYAQIDEEGNHFLFLGEITDHHSHNTAIHHEDKFIMHGNKIPCRTTQGWYLLVTWCDSSSWEPLCNRKDSHPIEVAQYTVANKLLEEAAYAWWVPLTLKKCDYLVSALQTCAQKYSQKLVLKYHRW